LRPSLHLKLDSIRHNVGVWREVLGGRPLLAVVKCDAYRMGMVPVARAALDNGAQGLCVVEISEASELRAAGIKAPIVQVAATPSEDFVTALEDKVTVSVGDAAKAAELSRIATKLGVRAQLHVAIETGTGWWGVPAAQAASFASDVAALDNLVWEGVWTHIAGRDSMDAQMDRFRTAVRLLRESGLAVPLEHAASTGPTLWGLAQGAARIGVGLYGSSLNCGLPGNQWLQAAFEVRAPVYAVRTFTEDTPLGYGGAYTAVTGETIVTLRIGYGEGLPKALAGRGCAMIAGAACPIVGAIGMNFTMVAVPPNVRVDVGQDALLAGDIPGLRLDDLAQAAATIPHNVMTTLGSGMTRVYSEDVDRATLFARSD
jgi:alanine racemase